MARVAGREAGTEPSRMNAEAFEILFCVCNIWFSGIASTLLNIFIKHVSYKNNPRTIWLLILGFPVCSMDSSAHRSQFLFKTHIQWLPVHTAGPHEGGRKMFAKEPGRRQAACAKNEVSFMFFDNFEISLSYSFLSVY